MPRARARGQEVQPAQTPAAAACAGICIDPAFDFKRLPLLDRGVCYAIAHVRGGGEMGRAWYEDGGKYLTKRNTFTDFVDVAKGLVESGMTTPERLAITGRSAGGLLVGAAINLAPDAFGVAVAGVPFVDVMGARRALSSPVMQARIQSSG